MMSRVYPGYVPGVSRVCPGYRIKYFNMMGSEFAERLNIRAKRKDRMAESPGTEGVGVWLKTKRFLML
jgi:hypothetical protein